MSNRGPTKFQIFLKTSDDENESNSPRLDEWSSPQTSQRGPVTPKGLTESDLSDVYGEQSLNSWMMPQFSASQLGNHESLLQTDQNISCYPEGNELTQDTPALDANSYLVNNPEATQFVTLDTATQMHTRVPIPEATYTYSANVIQQDLNPAGNVQPADSTVDGSCLEDVVEALTMSILSKLEVESDEEGQNEEAEQTPRETTATEDEQTDTDVESTFLTTSQSIPLRTDMDYTGFYSESDLESVSLDARRGRQISPNVEPFVPNSYSYQSLTSTMYGHMDSYAASSVYQDAQSGVLADDESSVAGVEQYHDPDLMAWLQQTLEAGGSSALRPAGVATRKPDSGPYDPAILHTGPAHMPGDIPGSIRDRSNTVEDVLSLPVFSSTDPEPDQEKAAKGDVMLEMAQEMAEEVPTVYVSPNGLLTVLLRHEVTVEMTLDRSIRVVNHRHQSVAATNNRGNSSCIYHACAKIFQERTTTDVEVFWDRRAKFNTRGVKFSHGSKCYHVDRESRLEPCELDTSQFADQSSDLTVSLLYSDSLYGPQLLKECTDAAKASNYVFHRDGSVSVFIQGVRICQLTSGDVVVTCGPKQLRVSPVYGSLYLRSHFVEMAVEMNWNVKVRRGDHRLHASFTGFLLTDGIQEFGFDQYRQAFLQPHADNWHTIIDEEVIAEAESLETEDALAAGESGERAPPPIFPGMVPPAPTHGQIRARGRRRSRHRGGRGVQHQAPSLRLAEEAATYMERQQDNRRIREFYNSNLAQNARQRQLYVPPDNDVIVPRNWRRSRFQ